MFQIQIHITIQNNKKIYCKKKFGKKNKTVKWRMELSRESLVEDAHTTCGIIPLLILLKK